MLNLQFNTRVRISVPGQGAAIGRVEDIRPAAEMPDLAGFAAAGPEANLMEQGVNPAPIAALPAGSHSQ